MPWSKFVTHHYVVKRVCGFLHVRETLALQALSQATKTAIRNPSVCCSSIALSPLTGSERFAFWEHCLRARLAESNKLASNTKCKDRVLFYLHALKDFDDTVLQTPRSEWQHVGGKAGLKRTGQEGEILRDLPRTLPHAKLFQGDNALGQNMLANVLRALLVTCPEIGYCQGMNFVAATIVVARLGKEDQSYIDDLVENRSRQATTEGERASSSMEYVVTGKLLEIEADSFWLMVALMTNASDISMSDLWGPGTPKVKLRSFQYDQLMQQKLPDLYAHFKNVQFTPDVLVTQWFMTLFCYTLSLEMTLHVWDFIFFQGWAGIFAVALAILDLVAPQLTTMNLDDIGMTLRSWRNGHFGLPCSSRGLILGAIKARVNHTQLLELQDQFAMQLIRELSVHLKAQRAFNPARAEQFEWLFRYGDPHAMLSAKELQEFMRNLSQMSQDTTTDVAALQEKINQASKDLEQARKEREDTGKETQRTLQKLRDLIEERERLISTAHKMADSLGSVGCQQESTQEDLVNSRTAKIGIDDEAHFGRLRFSGKSIWASLLMKNAQPRSEMSPRPASSRLFTESSFSSSNEWRSNRPVSVSFDVGRTDSSDMNGLATTTLDTEQRDLGHLVGPGLPGHGLGSGNNWDRLVQTIPFDGPNETDDTTDETGVSRKWNMLTQLPAGQAESLKSERNCTTDQQLVSTCSSDLDAFDIGCQAKCPNQHDVSSFATRSTQSSISPPVESLSSDTESEGVKQHESYLPDALAFDYEEASNAASSMVRRVMNALTGNSSGESSREASPRRLSATKFKKLSRDTRTIQDEVIRLEGEIRECTNLYQSLAEEYQVADTALEEAEFFKESLCRQLMQVVEEASSSRSERLQQIADQLSR